MKITVNKDNVKMEEFDVVHEGEHRVNKCSFSFSEEYTEELVKKAIFTSQNSSVEVAIINNECNIPTEILKARNIVLLGVYAYKVVDDKLDLRYSPSPDAFKVNSGSYIEGASKSEEITPSQFEQYMQALNDGLNKVEESIKKMDEATSSATQLVDNINQKLENGDFIGPEGSQGPQGIPGKDGTNGKDGADGVGITTITSGQSTVEADKTITPVIVQKTDGSSESFNVEAKNGLDGQNGQDGKDGVNGQDGLTPSIGENGNWYLGDTDTGKPSRGEVGPTPDLSDYVKNTDYASYSKGGVIKTDAYSVETDSNGFLRGKILTKEQFVATGNSDIISKGTMENIKDDYVESSNPVITLNNTLDNLVRKNRVSDYIVSLKDALKYKVFEFLVHGKVKQETTTGKNLLNYLNVKQFVSNGVLSIINNDGSITTTGTPTMNYAQILNLTDITDMLEDGQTYTIMQKNATNKLYIQVNITTNSDESAYVGLNSNTENIKTFTVDKQNNKKYMIDIQSNSIETTGELNITNYYQLLKGSYDEWQPFEKYTGGQPSPSPDYTQEITTLTFDKITRCRKNLATENFANQNSSINLARTLKTGEKITIVVNMTAVDNSPVGYGMNIYDQDNEQLWGNSYSNWQQPYDGWNSFVVTVKNDTSRLRINAYGYQEIEIATAVLSGALVVENKYVNDGSLYEPYQGQTYDIDLQGNEMVELPNGVKDELVIDKYGNVSLIKNVGKVIFDGSEDEYWTNTYGTNLFDLQDYFNSQNQFVQQAIALSNYYIYNSAQSSINENLENGEFALQKIKIPMGIVYNVFFKNNSCSTVDEWKAWLQEHNVTVYYQLANPQTISLGKLTDIITTLNGTNNISINGNIPTTISITYALDIKKYIDNKLAEISTAMIEER